MIFKHTKKILVISFMILFLSFSLVLYRVFEFDNKGFECSAAITMSLDDTKEAVMEGMISFDFSKNKHGLIIFEGYSQTDLGNKYMHRYLNFDYTDSSISKHEKTFELKDWVLSKSPTDESPDFLMEYFVQELAASNNELFLKVHNLSSSSVLLSSINSPLVICSIDS